MTTYARDSFGVPIEIIEPEPAVVERTFDDRPVHEDETYLQHEAYVKKRDNFIVETNCLFEEDVYRYIETLHPKNLIEMLSKLDREEIMALADMKEVKPLYADD